jgi:hypothetical protein
MMDHYIKLPTEAQWYAYLQELETKEFYDHMKTRLTHGFADGFLATRNLFWCAPIFALAPMEGWQNWSLGSLELYSGLGIAEWHSIFLYFCCMGWQHWLWTFSSRWAEVDKLQRVATDETLGSHWWTLGDVAPPMTQDSTTLWSSSWILPWLELLSCPFAAQTGFILILTCSQFGP